ncbi:MAG TPA: RdgB/HAM1 family non-canonical purine NTP pyrophosphatase [Xanthomonadales bacterium]|nr:RdgB/HAM1 family non-canonical purine NTP pyrophosphatase [Xanthomonadales bacterium]
MAESHKNASRTLVLASGNPGKLREFAGLLQPLNFEVRPQSDWDVPPVAEDACTFLENALIKARHASRCTGLPALADDSGLVVPALGGAPGVHSARYAGSHGDAGANNRKLLDAMQGLEGAERAAYFHCAMVLLKSADDPVPRVASASWWGEIAREERGRNGFGYDPLFCLPERQCTAAELSSPEKARLSHRGQATRLLLGQLKSSDET